MLVFAIKVYRGAVAIGGLRRDRRRRQVTPALAAMFETGHRHADERGGEIDVRHGDKREARMGRNQHDAGGDEDQHRVRLSSLRIKRLEASKADRAHHQDRRNDHHRKCG